MPFQLFEKARFHFIGLSKEDVDEMKTKWDDDFDMYYEKENGNR